jgi:hypothetical protein
MPSIAVLLFVLVDLMLHLVKRFVECHFGIFTFHVGNNRVISFDFDQHFHVDSRTFEFQRHIDFTDGIQIPKELLGLLSNIVTKILPNAAMSTGNRHLHPSFLPVSALLQNRSVGSKGNHSISAGAVWESAVQPLRPVSAWIEILVGASNHEKRRLMVLCPKFNPDKRIVVSQGWSAFQ